MPGRAATAGGTGPPGAGGGAIGIPIGAPIGGGGIIGPAPIMFGGTLIRISVAVSPASNLLAR